MQEIVITAKSGAKNYWYDLWRFRELFYILSWRDIKVRYKQTVLGTSWTIIRPLLTTIIFTVVFGKVAKLESINTVAPYALIVFSGMLPWQLFSTSISDASNSLIGNANLITKVYFPRMIIPTSAVITNLVDLVISTLLLFVLMLWYQFAPTWRILFLPVFSILAFFASLGVGLLLTSLNVKFRDFRYIIPFFVQFGLYVSPVGFTSSTFSGWQRLLYSLNPMVGVIDGFRWCIIGEAIWWPGFLLSISTLAIFLTYGIILFRRTEKNFADLI